MQFTKATKKNAKLRLALVGPPGSGKTYTGIGLACCLGARVAVIDTEHGSASKYADIFGFDVLELESFAPQQYVDALAAAAKAGYEVVVVDSLSHAWTGKDGALEQVDRAAAKNSGNSFAAWRNVTPQHNSLVEAIIRSPLHVIATMRSKMEYVVEENERGKKVPRRVGMAPVQREGLEYEFDIVGDMDNENTLVITKSRCPAVSGAVVRRPGKTFAEKLQAWLVGGQQEEKQSPAFAPPASQKPAPVPKQPEPPPATATGTMTGAEFDGWLHEADGILAKRGRYIEGQLLREVRARAEAHAPPYPAMFTAWDDNQILQGKTWVREIDLADKAKAPAPAKGKKAG